MICAVKSASETTLSPMKANPRMVAIPLRISEVSSTRNSSAGTTSWTSASAATVACSTSAHCIGAAAQQIAWGMQDVMFAGGGEELSWGMSLLFDGMGAMSSKYNATPEKAARAYDANRDGFVIAGGAGVLALDLTSAAAEPGPEASAPRQSSQVNWQCRARKLDSRWWPLWVLLGAVAVVLLLTAGLVLGIVFVIFRTLHGIIRALFR